MSEDSLEALITRCPNCDTRFRVSEAQLQVAAGRVRCGACLGLFDGVQHLLFDGEEFDPESCADVDKVLETASAIPTPTNKEKLHTIKKKFIIDENHIVDNPEGMDAELLESKVHNVTVSSVGVRNIET